METIGADEGRHVVAAEVDRASAAQWLGAARQHEGFVGAGVLEDLFGLDRARRISVRFSDRPEELAARATPRPWLPVLLPSAVATTLCSPHIAESSLAVSGSCTAANSRQEVASYQ